MTLLESQFERLADNPGDKLLLKQLAVDFGAKATRTEPLKIRDYRVFAAKALGKIEKLPKNEDTIYVIGALHALLDAAACAEDSHRYKDELKATELEDALLKTEDSLAISFWISEQTFKEVNHG